jgi:glycerate kinase
VSGHVVVAPNKFKGSLGAAGVAAAVGAGLRAAVPGLDAREHAVADGGAGMVQALGARLLDAAGAELPPGGAALAHLDRVDLSGFDPRVADAEFVVASDVDNPLLGPHGAAAVYGPQKGASPADWLGGGP